MKYTVTRNGKEIASGRCPDTPHREQSCWYVGDERYQILHWVHHLREDVVVIEVGELVPQPRWRQPQQ